MQHIEKTVLVHAPPVAVWQSLIHPALIKQWMEEEGMNLEITTDWKVGSPISIKGFHHVKFEVKGTVLRFDANQVLSYTHLSSVSRLPDKPENYTIYTFLLTPVQDQTRLTLALSNFPTESIFKHLEFYWNTTLEILKIVIEKRQG